MLNPTLSAKKESNLTVTESTKKLFQVIYKDQKEPEKEDSGEPKIKVSSLVSKMAFYYEKIRNSVDYKEEHLLRKDAIMRILKRQLVIEGVLISEIKTDVVSRNLLIELIRAGYLPNNKIPESKIGEIALVIGKYIKLKSHAIKNLDAQNGENSFKIKNELSQWIIAMMGCDIEERLGRNKVNQMVIGDMYKILDNLVELPDSFSEDKQDKEVQIYIAIHRNLFKFDSDMVAFIIFKYYNGSWNNAKDEDIASLGKNIFVLKKAIAKQIEHPLSGQLNFIISRYSVFYGVLTEVIANNPVVVYENLKNDPKAFPRDIKDVCKKKYTRARSKLWRSAIRSIVYIFFTKSIFAFIIEVPATRWFDQKLNFWALAINVAFPALLLFLIILFTKLPSEANTNRIIEGIGEIAFVEKERKEPIRLRDSRKRRKVLNSIFGIIYGGAFFFSISVIIWGLDKIGFNWVSITIFLFFLAFVSFFAIRIRQGAKEFFVIESKESIFTFLSDFFYIPIVAVGKWLSEKFSRLNVFVFILDFIIEAPFKIFIEIAEEWTKYVRERKEEIV